MGKYKIYDFLGGLKIPISQEYGNDVKYYKKLTLDPKTGLSTLTNGHEGTDFAAITGTKLYCPFEKAIIVREGINMPGWVNYGILTVLYDPIQNCAMWFCHLQKFLFEINDVIKRGDVFAITNNTGNTNGEHVHVNFCETDNNGARLNQENGSLGFLDLMDENLVTWLPYLNPVIPSVPASKTTSPNAPGDTQSIAMALTIPSSDSPNDYMGIKKSDFQGMHGKCDKYDPILAAGYPDIASIDEKINGIIQEKADAQKSYEEALKKAHETSTNLAFENKELMEQKAAILVNWADDTKKDSSTVQAGIDAMGKVGDLEKTMRTIASATGAKKPTDYFILSKIDEFFTKFDYFKRKATIIDQTANSEKDIKAHVDSLLRVFGITSSCILLVTTAYTLYVTFL